ncbi:MULTISPECIES: tail fiber domain-containing protein [Enterobacter]|uniref:Peptidase S74 domain-containing protein n=1 Tax=Enterobacter bugandensis TaxID=881260 RepID=A0ABX4VEP9_9ENTR|nr:MULTISPECIES: tail fiber domain-containing protein [Enterobacter]MBZ6366180.1 tail fiber domain-containing protein [Enterobacter bugandensis]NUX25223.1 tail fiber domain-containing protein [Enterobacter bugandensis]NUX48084.1 tail fiber domain-containing protein [Enterobacter bugandensis]NUX69038.1 tail fiber domain-containing protein [Enterobacter bugandensis]NUX94362.1 tail fiber domain-containing protein [Enterobacter bugandensis]
MSAGTINLTNGSAVVGGTGTSFTSDLAAGDFIVSTVGGVPYTLPVKSVESNTQLTLVSIFTGPTQSGAAWSAVPRVALNMVTAALVAQSAEALRGLNYDKQNWQQVFSAAGNITVKLPDGTTFTGPSWNYLSTQFGNKLNTSGGTLTGQLNLRGAPISADANSVISANGGLDVDMGKGFALKGKVQQGEGKDNNILSVSGDGNTGATGFVGAFQYNWYADGWIAGITRGSGTNTLTYSIYYNGASYGTGSKLWSFNYDGSATSQGAWVNGSDERHKSNIEPVAQPLAAVLYLRGVTYDIQDGERGVGLIAQDVEKWCPDAVKTYGDRKFSDGTVIENFKFLDTSGVAAAYHTEAIKELFNLVELVLNDPEKARDVINAVKIASELSQSGS